MRTKVRTLRLWLFFAAVLKNSCVTLSTVCVGFCLFLCRMGLTEEVLYVVFVIEECSEEDAV